MKEKRNNQKQASKLLRILENITDFELILCSYQNALDCRKMHELVCKQSKSASYKILNIDLLNIHEVDDFQNSIPKTAENYNDYYVINVIGLDSKIEPDEPCGFLNGINLQRKLIAEQSPYTLIFWLPEGLLERFSLDAPDLWSLRNSVLVFIDEEGSRRNTDITSLEFHCDSDFSNYTIKEKKLRMEYLANLIIRLKRGAETSENQEKMAQAIFDQGELFRLTGEWNNALNCFCECRKLWEKLGDQKMIARSCNKTGNTFFSLGNYKDAMVFHKMHEQISKELNNEDELAKSYGNLANILQMQGKLDEAMSLHKKEEKIRDKLGDLAGLAISYANQALILSAWGKLDEAMSLHKKEEKIKGELGDISGLAISYANQAVILQMQGKLDEAMSLHKKEEKIKGELGDISGLATSYTNQAVILYVWGKLDEAMSLHKKEEKIKGELGDIAGLAISYWNQGIIYGVRGDRNRMIELWEKSINMNKCIGIPTTSKEDALKKFLE